MTGNGFKLVGTNGQISWDFLLTDSTTNNEIEKIKPENCSMMWHKWKQLEITIQKDGLLFGPMEMAKQARQALQDRKHKIQKPQPPNNTNKFLTCNMVLEEDPLTQQSRGVLVTVNGRRLANENVLEYTFQV